MKKIRKWKITANEPVTYALNTRNLPVNCWQRLLAVI